MPVVAHVVEPVSYTHLDVYKRQVLHGSDHKWLDLTALLSTVLHVQDPASVVASVDYFTSPVIARLATRGQASNDAQHR